MKIIEILFLLDQIPSGTSQMKRVNHSTGRFFEGPKLREAREEFERQLRPFAPDHPIEGPLRLEVCFTYFTKDKKKDKQWKTSRPDCDNVVKLLQDVMTKLGYWNDDSQIAVLKVSKKWSCDTAKVYVKVEEVW